MVNDNIGLSELVYTKRWCIYEVVYIYKVVTMTRLNSEVLFASDERYLLTSLLIGRE